jgi:hypothetical protein
VSDGPGPDPLDARGGGLAAPVTLAAGPMDGPHRDCVPAAGVGRPGPSTRSTSPR